MRYFQIEVVVYYNFYIEAQSREIAEKLINNCEYDFESKGNSRIFQEYKVVGEASNLESDMILLHPKL